MAVAVAPLAGERLQKLLSLLQLGNEPQARFGPTGCVLPARFADSAREIKAFEVRDDDVWIVTPPRCGTTWTQEMVWLILHDLDFEASKKQSLFTRSPFFEFSRFLPAEIVSGVDLDTVQLTESAPAPRCVKTHLHKGLLPDQLWTKKAKIVYLAREPKDVAVSFYYQYQLTRKYTGDKNLFFDCFYEDLVHFSPLWEHIVEFWEMKDEPNVLFITYEDMKQDLPTAIRRTAKFLGKNLSAAQVALLAEHLDIRNMRENAATNLDDVLQQARLSKGGEQKFIRKGVVGEGRREMSPERIARFDERTRRVFAKTAGGCPWKI